MEARPGFNLCARNPTSHPTKPPHSWNFLIPETPPSNFGMSIRTGRDTFQFLHRIILCRQVIYYHLTPFFSFTRSIANLSLGFLYSHCSLMLVHTSHKFHVEAMIKYLLGSLTEALWSLSLGMRIIRGRWRFNGTELLGEVKFDCGLERAFWSTSPLSSLYQT